ncbi:MAG: DUF6179 domain-containing protein [Raoultibacter sp.]
MDNTSKDLTVIAGDLVQGAAIPDTLGTIEQLTFQTELWKLLAKRTSLYTMGESSSVPELTAHRLLASVCFMLGIEGDDLDPEAMHRLVEGDLEATFNQNLECVMREVERTVELWEAAARSTPLLESTALKDTLESLRNFPVQYDYRSFAHEIPSDIDYPLAHPVSETLQGVVYVNEYLTRLLIENNVMQRFDLARCKLLLQEVSPEYCELIINLYEPIAVNAIGLALAGCMVRDLAVSEEARQRIAELCCQKPRRVLEQMLVEAASQVCSELHIDDEQVRDYVCKTAIDLRARIACQVNTKSANAGCPGLAGVFLSF